MSDINKIKLKNKKSKTSVNENINTKVSLTSNEEVLPLGDINKVLNIGEQFNKERNESDVYNFIFTITPLFSNVLYNVRGDSDLGTFGNSNIPKDGNGLTTFESVLFRENPYDGDFNGEIELSYKEALDRSLKEVNGWFGFDDPDLTRAKQCDYFDLEPNRGRFDLNSNINKNWDICMVYPSINDYDNYLVKDGLLITEAKSVKIVV